MSDLISRQYVLNKLSRNSVFKAITNAEGQSAIDIVQNAPDAFQSYDNRLTALEIYNNLHNLDMCTYGQLCYLIIEENKKCGTTNADRIRNMDNAGLADYIYGVSEGTKPCVLCDGDCDFCEESPEQCKEKIVKWLKTRSKMNKPCELYQLIPRDKLNRIFEMSDTVGAECDYTFLGFEEVYKAVTLFVPKSKVIIDLGCAYAFQAWYFRDYRKYICVDIWDSAKLTLNEFDMDNSEFYHMSIQTFIKDVFQTLGYTTDEVFAVCSYVPDEGAREMAMNFFPYCLVYYPTRD